MCVVLIVMDVLWVLTMRQVWANKLSNNHTNIAMFDYVRPFTLFFSVLNIVLKVALIIMLFKQSKKSPTEVRELR